MKLTIERVGNGYILSWQEEEHAFLGHAFLEDAGKYDFELGEEREVIENKDDDKKAMEELLYRVAEFFGVSYDKFKEDNLNILWNKRGHKISWNKREHKIE